MSDPVVVDVFTPLFPLAAKTFVNIGRVYRVSASCIVFPVNSLSTYDFITTAPPPGVNRCCATIHIGHGSRWKPNAERSVNNSVDDGCPPRTQTFTRSADRRCFRAFFPLRPDDVHRRRKNKSLACRETHPTVAV